MLKRNIIYYYINVYLYPKVEYYVLNHDELFIIKYDANYKYNYL